jgi:hypothetical protein
VSRPPTTLGSTWALDQTPRRSPYVNIRRPLSIVLASSTAVVASGLLAAPATPSSPRFARTYVGTVTGTSKSDGRTESWTVSGMTFKLQHARLARGRWGGTYLVSGGRVTFTTKATGECRFTKTGSFSLGHLPWIAASISFLQNLRGSGYSYEARASKPREIAVAGQCGDGTNARSMQDVISPAGGLWLRTDINERFEPGRRLKGSYTEKDDRDVTTWTWNLAPRS